MTKINGMHPGDMFHIDGIGGCVAAITAIDDQHEVLIELDRAGAEELIAALTALFAGERS